MLTHLHQLIMKNRLLICTFLALTSGLLGGYMGGQMRSMLHNQKCQNPNWGLKMMCHAWVTPAATWKGTTTGLWTGTILGAFAGGAITYKQDL
jgi:hypothetical protein